MTSEHVFPLWTRGTVHPDARGDSGYIFRGADSVFQVVPGMPVAALEVKRVCARCNNGWMSDLERKAKPFLTRPIQGDPKNLRFAEIETVAAWAYKTCVLADLASTRLLGALAFRWLGQRQRPPAETVITMAAYGGGSLPTVRVLDPGRVHGQIGLGSGSERPGIPDHDQHRSPRTAGVRASHPRRHRPRADRLET
jgi:hypothetical protein